MREFIGERARRAVRLFDGTVLLKKSAADFASEKSERRTPLQLPVKQSAARKQLYPAGQGTLDHLMKERPAFHLGERYQPLVERVCTGQTCFASEKSFTFERLCARHRI
jgi:hypothetical protein